MTGSKGTNSGAPKAEVPCGAEKRQLFHLRALMAAAGEGFLVVAADGTVLILNEAGAKLLDVDRGSVVRKPYTSFRIPGLDTQIARALKAGPRAPDRTFVIGIGESTLGCRIARYAAQEERGIVVTIRDDTELVRQQERADAILSSTGDGLIVFSPDSVVTYMNLAAADMLGLKPAKVIGKHTSPSAMLGLEPGDSTDAIPCWVKKDCDRIDCPQYGSEDLRCWLVSGTFCDGTEAMVFQAKQGICESCDVYSTNLPAVEAPGMEPLNQVVLSKPEHRIVDTRTNPVIDGHGHFIGFVVNLRDVTAEYEIMQMKNEFVSTVSHELRTPMTSIKGYVDLILDGDAGEINEIQRDFLQIVKENSDRLVELINDMLDISRIESGRIHLKIVPLSMLDAVEGAVDSFRAVLEQSGRNIVVQVAEGLPRVAGDRDRVGQVLINFISNALKYSPGGGTVTIRARHTGDVVAVSVSDQGIGISREDQKNLFTKFYRVDSTLTREIGGTGLGLSICKSIIELLGGKVSVRSKPGEGSTFTFALPVAPRELVRTPSVEGPVASGGKVLVVDRDPEIAALIETYLLKRGYEVIKAYNAADALEMAKSEKPRVITLDVILDGADGFELLQRLKDHEETATIPVVVLSIVCDEGRSCRLGAANYLEKPIDQARLLKVLDDLVGSITKPVVLIADDDHGIVDVMSMMLKARGFAVVSAYDGLEAMAAIEQHKPHLILLDLRMPNMDGYEVIKAVKGDEATADIPIVVMTAYHIDESRVDILSMAADSLSKPLSMESIADRVTELLGAGA